MFLNSSNKVTELKRLPTRESVLLFTFDLLCWPSHYAALKKYSTSSTGTSIESLTQHTDVQNLLGFTPLCSIICWLCINWSLIFFIWFFIFLQYFMQYVLWAFPGFSGFLFTWWFPFVSTWKRLIENVLSYEFTLDPYCVGLKPMTRRWAQKGNSNAWIVTRWSQYCCVCARRLSRELNKCWSGWTALKKNLFCTGCCSIVVSVHLWCKNTKLLFFVFFCFCFFFNYLRCPSLLSGFISAELLTDANKDKFNKKAFVVLHFFFFAAWKKRHAKCKASRETPVMAERYWVLHDWKMI